MALAVVVTEVDGRMSWTDAAWIHFKLALAGVWVALIVTVPSEFLANYAHTWFFAFWMLSALGGTAVSVTGLLMSAGPPPMRRKGFRVELVGLCGAAAGPLCYFAISIVDFIDGETTPGRLIIAGLAYALFAALVARIVTVVQAARRREYQVAGLG